MGLHSYARFAASAEERDCCSWELYSRLKNLGHERRQLISFTGKIASGFGETQRCQALYVSE